MGDQALTRSGTLDSTGPVKVSPAFVVPVIVVSVVAVAAVALVVLLCIQKKKKESYEERRPTEDGVQEDLIEANNNNAQTYASPDQVSELKQGLRNQPTNGVSPMFEFPSAGNPEHKKWYESKAIPFMDASVGSIPEAVEPTKV